MKTLRHALAGLALASLVLGVVDLYVVAVSDEDSAPRAGQAAAVVLGWAFVGTGLIAWLRRPSNRIGALMTWVGFAWLFGPLELASAPLPFLTGVILLHLGVAALGHLLLAFPTGALDSRRARLIVAFGYWAAVGMQLVAILFVTDFNGSGHCESCPSNPIGLWQEPDIHNGVHSAQMSMAIFYFALVTRYVARRWRSFGRATRDALAPVLLTGGATLALLGVGYAADLAGAGYSFQVIGATVAAVAFMTVPFAFVAGLLRSRLTRSGAVSELIATLGESSRRDHDIRALLADALGDPSVTLAYWLPDRAAYVDGEGNPVELPSPGERRQCSLVEDRGEPVAAIIFDADAVDDPQLVKSVGGAATLALSNRRLEAQLHARVEELRASRARIVDASDNARRRIERDLHDGAQQHMVSLALNLRLARNAVEAGSPEAVELVDEAIRDVESATAELRELARGIHPAVLTNQGLGPALEVLASRSSVPVELSVQNGARLPEQVAAGLYFAVAEGLTNVEKYAAASRAQVRVWLEGDEAIAQIADDGNGGASPNGGTGLSGLVDRLAALDGSLEIISPKGRGTTLTAKVPCEF